MVTVWMLLSSARAGVAVERDCGDTARAVSIEMVCGNLSLSGSSRSNVRVTGSVDDLSGLDISSSGGRVRIELKSGSGPLGRANCGQLHVEIPALAELQASTVSAPLSLQNLLGEIEAESVSGNITLEGAPSAIEIETVSGDIRITSPSRNIEAETVSGQIDLRGVGGDIEAVTVSGDLSIQAGSDLHHVEAGSVSGDITLAGPLTSCAEIEAATHSGDITLMLPRDTPTTVSTSTFSGQIVNSLSPPSGDSHVEVGTFSGDVRIKSLP